MKVILTETIPSLGIIGSEVIVANGYARNFLFPQGKAMASTPANHKRLAQEKAKFELQIAREKETAVEMAKRLDGVSCTIAAKVSDGDRLYGSVTVRDVLDALAKQDIEIEKRMLLLAEPIKTLGTFEVPIRVYKGVEAKISVEIVAES